METKTFFGIFACGEQQQLLEEPLFLHNLPHLFMQIGISLLTWENSFQSGDHLRELSVWALRQKGALVTLRINVNSYEEMIY